jgi:hypothetical protein
VTRRSDLVAVRVGDLEPGRRVRLPRMRSRELVEVLGVTENEHGVCIVETERGSYPCEKHDLIDAEDEEL